MQWPGHAASVRMTLSQTSSIFLKGAISAFSPPPGSSACSTVAFLVGVQWRLTVAFVCLS